MPADVTALTIVTVQSSGSARVRNQPGGDTLVAAVPSGTQVEVLGGKVNFNNIVWLQARLPGGQVGWTSDFLVRITRRTPEFGPSTAFASLERGRRTDWEGRPGLCR